MKKIINMMQNWNISYDPYSDLFQIYDRDVFNMPKRDLITKKEGRVRVYLSKETSQPLFLEIQRIYDEVGIDIDNMVKLDIIRALEPYINKYV